MNNIKQSKKKFCILTTQRSGSAWLISLLDSHPQIKAFYEIFLAHWAGDDFLVSFPNYQKDNSGLRPWLTFKYLNELDHYPGEHETIGFKIMYNQLVRHPEVLAKLVADNYKIIHLVRENYLDLAISSASMVQNGLIHTKTDVKANPVTLDPPLLLKYLSRQESFLSFAQLLLKALPIPKLQITYNDLCKAQEATLNSLTDFLEIPNSEYILSSDRKKVNKGSYRQKIANYDQVRQALSGTKFAKMLSENQ